MERHRWVQMVGRVGFAVLLCVAQESAAGPFREALKTMEPVEVYKPKSIDTKSITERGAEDIRLQKEEAAKSLNDTLKEIDERARTRAIEDGLGVVVE